MNPKFAVQHQTSFYAPADASWAGRMEAACRVLEAAFPGERMMTALPYRVEKGPTPIANRDKHLRRLARNKTLWVSINNGKFIYGRGDTGTTDPGHLSIGGRTHSWMPGVFQVSTFHPESPWDFNERLLVQLGDALGAYTGWLSPTEAFRHLRQVIPTETPMAQT